MQSGPDAFDKSRFLMTFSTILGVTEILCSFRLVLEEKTGKDIPESSRLKLLEKFLANNFALSDTEDNTSKLLSRGSITNLPLLRTLFAICPKSLEPSFWEVIDSFVLLAYVSLEASVTFSQQYHGDENHGDEWGLTWCLPAWTHSQNSLAAEALSLKISSHGHLSNDHKDCPNQHKDSHKLCNKTGHPTSVPYPAIFLGCQFFDEPSKEKNHCAAGDSGGILANLDSQ